MENEGLDELEHTFCRHRYRRYDGTCLNCGDKEDRPPPVVAYQHYMTEDKKQ